MVTTVRGSAARSHTGTLSRVGLSLAGVLGIADIAFGISQLGPDATIGADVGIVVLAAGLITLVLIPFAWQGLLWAAWSVVLLRIASALTGLPAFFVAGVPAGLVVAAAGGIVLAVACAVLVLARFGRS